MNIILLLTLFLSCSDDGDLPSPAVETEISSSPEDEIGIDGARHLLDRTSFGATFEETLRFSRLDRKTAVAAILDGVRSEPVSPLPPFISLPAEEQTQKRDWTREERKKFQRRQRAWGAALRGWWIEEMITTDSPFTEQMVLFWHGHFTSELRKVKKPTLMWLQNQTFRKHAVGDFSLLLREVALGPAMVIYLDTQQNRKGKPNENFARELLELYSLGEGHYTESDIKETARSFTGFRVDRRSGKVRLIPRQHDWGEKTVFSKVGNLGPQQVLDAILENPRCAEYIVERFWTYFVSPTPDACEVRNLAKIFRDSEYQLRPLLEALFGSDAFWQTDNRASMIKSPVDLVIGDIRRKGLKKIPAEAVQRTLTSLGQTLLNPPNVKGWPGGSDWITATTLLERERFLGEGLRNLALLDARASAGRKTTPDGEEMEPGDTPEMNPDSDRPRNFSRRLSRRERQRLTRKFTAELQQRWKQFGEMDSERREASRMWLLATEPVTAPPKSPTAINWLRWLYLDPTHQLK